MMKLRSIDLHDFKSIHEASVHDLEDISVIFGPTNSGKTSVLESVFFQFKHQQLTRAEAYDEFLHSKANKNDAVLQVATEWQVAEQIGDQTYTVNDRLRCVTSVTFQGNERPVPRDELYVNDKLVEDANQQRAVYRRIGESMKLSSSRRPGDSKRVYFMGEEEETTEQRTWRFMKALDDLEQHGQYWDEFLSRLQKLFPHLVYGTDQKKTILDFFGQGFLGTAKLFVYLYNPKHDLVLIDEPEIHFYPSLTHRFVTVLHEVVDQQHKQVILGTHATLFLRMKHLGSFYQVTKSKHYQTNIRRVQQGELLRGLDLVNANPETILQSDMVLYTEGPWDVGVIEEFLNKFTEFDHVNFAILQLGGGSMANRNIDPVKLKEHNPLSFILIDSERKQAGGEPDPSHKDFLTRCYVAKVYCKMLERQAIENYFTPRALRTVFGEQVPADITQIDPFTPLDKQGMPWFRKETNRSIARAMTREEIESYPDLKEFFGELIQVSRQVR